MPQPGCGGGCQQGKPTAFGLSLFFSIKMQDARGSEEMAGAPKAPPLPVCSPWGRHPHAGDMQLLAQPSLSEQGKSKVTLAARKGKLKGEAERDSTCPLSPLRAGSATEADERLARLALGPPAG